MESDGDGRDVCLFVKCRGKTKKKLQQAHIEFDDLLVQVDDQSAERVELGLFLARLLHGLLETFHLPAHRLLFLFDGLKTDKKGETDQRQSGDRRTDS